MIECSASHGGTDAEGNLIRTRSAEWSANYMGMAMPVGPVTYSEFESPEATAAFERRIEEAVAQAKNSIAGFASFNIRKR